MLVKILRLNTKLNLDFSSLSRKEHVRSSLKADLAPRASLLVPMRA